MTQFTSVRNGSPVLTAKGLCSAEAPIIMVPMKLLIVAGAVLAALTVRGASPSQDYPHVPVPFKAVRVEDAFWSPRLETNRVTTVWYDFHKCEETGRIDNFAKAGKLMDGPFRGTPFDDSDVFKVIEGAAYTLATHPDPKLDKYLDGLIAKIAAAQEPDGYLYTARTIDPKSRVDFFGAERWSNLIASHELYNVGHMYEAAVAHYEATGKRTLLNVALKNADLVCKTFGPGPGQLKTPPGHQEIEIGLVRLYRVTGDRKYLEQSRFFCDLRGRPETHKLFGPNQQDATPILQETEAVGHAVRAGYFYAGVADVAALLDKPEYTKAIGRIWDNVAGRKLHLTGGIGASPEGEAFGKDYELPNNNAYLETCAAIANAFWNHRMFLLHGEAKYVDVLERVIYNGFLAGISQTGDRFFYPNPLETDGKTKFNHGSAERAPWFGCSCCPVNDVRFFPQIPGYAYATRGEDVFINLFIGGTAKIQLGQRTMTLRQETQYPWDGQVTIAVVDTGAGAGGKDGNLNLRIPGWARNEPVATDLYRYSDGQKPLWELLVNGKKAKAKVNSAGYARLDRHWKAGDQVVLRFDMQPRKVISHPAVAADQGRFAIERGPLVYCAEGADNGGKVLDKRFAGALKVSVLPRDEIVDGLHKLRVSDANGTELTLLPYYAWCHRGPNEMRVWFPGDSTALAGGAQAR